MANEITVVGVNGRDVQLLMLFPIATPAEDSDGTAVTPTPSAGLPTVADAKLAQAEKDALDAGTAIFRTFTIHAEQGQSAANMLARARAIYAVEEAKVAARYAAKYQFLPRVGQRFDAVGGA